MQPTVGRIVHYTNLGDKDGRYPPQIQAAVITKVGEDTDGMQRVSLKILYETGLFDMIGVPFTSFAAGSDDARGKWTWPAQVPR